MSGFVRVRVLWQRVALDGSVTGVRYGWDDPEHGPVEHWVDSDVALDEVQIVAMRRLIENRVNGDPFRLSSPG